MISLINYFIRDIHNPFDTAEEENEKVKTIVQEFENEINEIFPNELGVITIYGDLHKHKNHEFTVAINHGKNPELRDDILDVFTKHFKRFN